MYVLTNKVSTGTLNIASTRGKYWIAAVLLLFGSQQLATGTYIYAKAILAQHLIQFAWQKTLSTDEQSKPWDWADTYPIAKLRVAKQELFVLAGASGRTLAFAPGHMSSSSLPGKTGNSVIVGHRDTHFNVLKNVKMGDKIEVQTPTGNHLYMVKNLQVVPQDYTQVLASSDQTLLTLITCYPFDSNLSNPELRYVVSAELLGAKI
jgi:sortase A